MLCKSFEVEKQDLTYNEGSNSFFLQFFVPKKKDPLSIILSKNDKSYDAKRNLRKTLGVTKLGDSKTVEYIPQRTS